MQLAVYDLVGALFVPDLWSGSRPTDKLFARILSIIMDRLADPDLGPHELATDAGISLRFIHKLFAERGSSCREFIYSLRLDHAAHLRHASSASRAATLNDFALTISILRKEEDRPRAILGPAPTGREIAFLTSGDGTVRGRHRSRAPLAHDF
jgi:AraC-like DNA-binding protein